jgi:1-aminocyclopropane-1-carboxylate deaminase/D-cysteine desulfhydrase-like pyridoxal-dependent ACC family enzyme
VTPEALRAALARVPALTLSPAPTPLEPLARLSAAIGGGPRLFIKRDDAIPFGFGGNKVRKLSFVAALAQQESSDTLITAGGIQSNHARATASTAAKLGMRAILVANGSRQARPTGNALLDSLLGADIEYVGTRDDRGPRMQEIAARLRHEGRRPFVIPIGASTPLGALGFVRALLELLDQMPPPDAIVHSTSSGGTQAGLVAAARLLGLSTRIIGVSADDPARALEAQVAAIVAGVGDLLDVPPDALERGTAIEVDDRFVGDGYGIPSSASREAIELAARTDAIFLDPTYTSKAMAALIASVRQQRFTDRQTVVFWHTGGQPGLFA